ncbi:MAG: hypothetical protein LBS85_00540, partial [Clostridiales Family XIII bacterium]|nr:hypothetical protein [Clostridiales Family XIII bacterium]
MNIITGKTGVPHVSSQQDADANAALYGDGDYVLDTGSRFKYTVVSNNLITLLDGLVMMQGRKGITDYGQTESIIIENGTQGQTRNDLIVARYMKDGTTQLEDMRVLLIKGVNGAGDPKISDAANIREGANIHDMALYRVRLDGIAIAGVDTLFRRLLLKNTVTRTSITVAAWNADKIATITDGNILSVDDLVYVAYDDT